MKIKCLNCQACEFDIEVSDFELDHTKVVSLTCPSCGASTAIQKRPGGGVEIAIDRHLERQRG